MKHIHRFFLNSNLAPGRLARLDDDDSFHAAKVLRLRKGAAVELVDLSGDLYEGKVQGMSGRAVSVAAGEKLPEPAGAADGSKELTVVQALPRGRRLDMVVEKLSELGVARLAPVYSRKSVAREAARREGKVERWRRIAKAAAGQAKRRRIMIVEDPVRLDEWLANFRGELLVLSTEVEGEPLGVAVTAGGVSAGAALPDRAAVAAGAPAEGPPPPDPPELALLIGPEAGFSKTEIADFLGRGARFVTLGPLVLRTETAAVAAAAIAMHRLGAMG